MYTVGLRVWIHENHGGLMKAREIMAKLAQETRRELELAEGGRDGLYHFVCKDRFATFLGEEGQEGAHEVAVHLFRNFPAVCRLPRADYEVVFDDETLG